MAIVLHIIHENMYQQNIIVDIHKQQQHHRRSVYVTELIWTLQGKYCNINRAPMRSKTPTLDDFSFFRFRADQVRHVKAIVFTTNL